MVAATYNENLTVNVISGESYFVTFDFERGIYFNMLSVKMCVKRALTWLLLPHAHKLCNLTHDFSPIWPQKPRFGKYEITTKQQYLKIIFFIIMLVDGCRTQWCTLFYFYWSHRGTTAVITGKIFAIFYLVF